MRKHLLNFNGGVLRLKKKVHYIEEIKWKVVKMKKRIIKTVQLRKHGKFKMFLKLRNG